VERSRLDWSRQVRHTTAFVLAAAITLAKGVSPDSSAAAAPPIALARLEDQIRAALARVRPAVVSITTLGVMWAPDPAGEGARGGAAVPYQTIGTGIIIDPRGYVLTNAHVVRNAGSISVKLWRAKPTVLAGQLLDRSEEMDLALIRLDGGGPFHRAELGRSGAVKVGDWVIAMGSPYGLTDSVTMGIVSDKARDLWIDGHEYKDLIQTDAAINQGNSGGPLINLKGEVVGVDTAIYAPEGISTGVGFAIPIARAREYLRSVVPGPQLAILAAGFEKEPIRPGAPSPHPDMGSCPSCHTFISPAPRRAATTVGVTVPVVEPARSPGMLQGVPEPAALHTMSARDYRRVIQRAAAVVLLAMAVWMIGRVL